MKLNPTATGILLFTMSALFLGSCKTVPSEARKRLDKANFPDRELEYVARSIEDFGTVSVSGTTLIEPDPDFKLDLEMTGKEIFERNRVEGFSGIRQYDSLDAQLGVTAEITQNLLGQLDSADPSMKQQIRDKLLAAAFQGLLGMLPEDMQGNFQDLLKPQPTPGAAATDGGVGALQQATSALARAKQLFSDADARLKDIDGQNVTDSAKLVLAEQGFRAVQDAAKLYGSAASLAAEAAGRAELLVNEAEANLLRKDPKAHTTLKGDLDKARAAAAAAKNEAETVASKLTERLPALQTAYESSEVAKEKLSAVIDAVNASLSIEGDGAKSAPEAVTKASAASGESLRLANLGGVQPAPVQKLLHAKLPEQRLAREQLPAWKGALENYDGDLALNLRQLMVLTASDKMTLEMLRWLSYPQNEGAGKRIYMCMGTVNIVPGRKTKVGYTGQVDVSFEYAYHNEALDSMRRMPNQHPIAIAVHPLIDTQVLDLRTSRRQTMTMAFQAIINGYPAAANLLLDYARQREQDAQTLTGLNTFTSYSTGSHIGFTFSPRFVAQGDPTNMNTGPAMALQPQTVPVVIMIQCEDEDLAIRDPKRCCASESTKTPCAACRGEACAECAECHARQQQVKELRTLEAKVADAKQCKEEQALRKHSPRLSNDEIALQALEVRIERETTDPRATHLIWYQTPNWLRTGRDVHGRVGLGVRDPRLNESELAARAAALDVAWDQLDAMQGPGYSQGSPNTILESHLQKRIDALESAGLGTQVYFRLPLPDTGGASGGSGSTTPPANILEICPTPLTLAPAVGWIDRATTAFITSDYQYALFTPDTLVSVGGRMVNCTVLSPTLLKFVVPAWLPGYKGPAKSGDTKTLQPPAPELLEAEVVVTVRDAAIAIPQKMQFRYYAPSAQGTLLMNNNAVKSGTPVPAPPASCAGKTGTPETGGSPSSENAISPTMPEADPIP